MFKKKKKVSFCHLGNYSSERIPFGYYHIYGGSGSIGIVTYASETWVLKKNIIQKLLVFERKIVRGIFGPMKENQTWRIKTMKNWTN